MSFVLTCPNCGPREVTDFGFGGEVTTRPSGGPDFRTLSRYVYFRANVAGPQREWWVHRSGCGQWFLAERDTRTNEVAWTALPGENPPPVGPPSADPAGTQAAGLGAGGGDG